MSNKKYEEIEREIDKLKAEKNKSSDLSGGSAAFNIAVELVAGVIVGVIIGLFFDNYKRFFQFNRKYGRQRNGSQFWRCDAVIGIGWGK